MIITNGKVRRTVPEQVSENMIDIQKLKDANFVRQDDIVDNLSSHKTNAPLSANQGRILKDMLNNAIAGVFKYKGSVATVSDLPANDNEIGDTYNVLDTGDNYTWDGTGWDKLSGIVDLSNYVTLDGEQTIAGAKTFSKIKFSGNQSDNIVVGTNTNNKIGIAGGNLFLDSSNYIVVGVGIRPYAADSSDLGSSSYTWKDIYTSGKIELTNISTNYQWDIYQDTYGYLRFSRNTNNRLLLGYYQMYCGADNNFDLGTNTFRYKDIYVAGNLSDGTNTVTIADLAALITYAKAQGWIQ